MRIFVFTSIFLLSFIVLLPSFGLGLFGDDWLAFFRYAQVLGPKSSGTYNHLSYFLTPYGAQDILMGLFQKVYGFNSSLYYFTSFIFRTVATFSFYPLVFYLTKNRIATFFAIAFFSITVTGFDTTNWVFNMPSYITIALFNLCLYFFLKARGEKKYISLIISGIFYYLASIITPIRMHGSLSFIFLLESFWLMQNRNLHTFKKVFIRFGLFLIIFLIIRYTGQSQGPPQEVSERLNLGIQAMLSMISRGRFDFILYPIIMFAGLIIPDFLLPPQYHYMLLLLSGIIFLSLVIFLLFKYYENYLISTGIFLGFSWAFMSFFFAWFWVPNTIFPTVYRYLIVSAQGITILLASLISLSQGKKFRNLILFFVLIIITIHIISTRIYINALLYSHSQEISNKIWSSIPYIPDIALHKEPVVIYFEGDNTNQAIIHDVITFGLPPHMALLYHLREEDGGLPIPMSNWQEVVSAVTDAKTLPTYGYPVKPVSIEKVYAFHLSGQDNLVDITDLARSKLKEIMSK